MPPPRAPRASSRATTSTSSTRDDFNRARAAGVAFIAAGNAPPAQLAVREDLRTRLGSGLVFQLHALGDEAKAGALRAQGAGRGMTLPEEVADYLRRRLPTTR